MSQFRQFIANLVNAAHDPHRLKTAYAAWLEGLLRSPSWSSTTPDGKRVPWRAAETAKDHPSMQAAFASPGIYLFGTSSGIPRYLGKAEDETLGERLFGRYLGGPNSKFWLAAKHGDALRISGVTGFPKDVLARNAKRIARLKGAVDFAQHGIEGMWIALIPISDKERVGPLERKLIAIARQWNISKGYPPLLNKQHNQIRSRQ